MVEIQLDPAIRTWVFMPIVLITFLVGVIRHYISIIFTSNRTQGLQEVIDGHILTRCRLIRENGRFLPKEALVARKDFLTNRENGFLLAQQRESQTKSLLSDPTMMVDILKGNAINMVPMVLIGGWINWAFSGFLCTKVPFPLTYRFKPMLQRGVDLAYLDPAWVSAVSWYGINLVGLRSLYTLVLGEDNAADIGRSNNQEQLIGHTHVVIQPTQDVVKLFKAEHDAISMLGQWSSTYPHQMEKQVLSQGGNRDGFTHKKVE